MPSTGLKGPYQLSNEEIDRVITIKSPGVYVLERNTPQNSDSFTVHYVGRSDDDLKNRLKNWVGVKGYKRFKCDYFASPKAAFERESMIYHDFNGDKGGMDNDIHPQRPEDSNWQCPICDVFKGYW